MKRLAVALLSFTLLAAPLAAEAQQAGSWADTVGVLDGGGRDLGRP